MKMSDLEYQLHKISFDSPVNVHVGTDYVQILLPYNYCDNIDHIDYVYVVYMIYMVYMIYVITQLAWLVQ